jgi:hypothetical protein
MRLLAVCERSHGIPRCSGPDKADKGHYAGQRILVLVQGGGCGGCAKVSQKKKTHRLPLAIQE